MLCSHITQTKQVSLVKPRMYICIVLFAGFKCFSASQTEHNNFRAQMINFSNVRVQVGLCPSYYPVYVHTYRKNNNHRHIRCWYFVVSENKSSFGIWRWQQKSGKVVKCLKENTWWNVSQIIRSTGSRIVTWLGVKLKMRRGTSLCEILQW